jgi:ribonuclease PH
MRSDGRKNDEIRKITIEIDYLEYPVGSCLITMGKTRVLCAVTVEHKVPHFLVGTGTGWLTAEYSMLPGATHERSQREVYSGRLKGRTQEIQRFIGRSLRPIFNLSLIGERTFIVDCDVLQADGGTRTAAVNGAFISLHRAISRMMQNKSFAVNPIIDNVAAISVGMVKGVPCVDLNYEEDSQAEIDMNLVMTGKGKLIEVQATAEHMPIDKEQFDTLLTLGMKGIKKIVALEKKVVGRDGT